ncbi:MAG: putative DNA binding domain-containing protein [Clostridiaceae bacterium]|nr:putative DNA binding domain-containing protein [Clostridiaceae bacterium]
MISINEIKNMREGQLFDRKSIKIEAKTLEIPILAFANAEGGTIAIGISDDGKIEGIIGHENKINEILRVPSDFCFPRVKVDFEYIDCIDDQGAVNKVLLLIVQQSTTVHVNQVDEAYYRIGNESKKLNFDERMQLMYDKGDMLYENAFVREATFDEIDLELVDQYSKVLGSLKMPYEFLCNSLRIVRQDKSNDKLSVAALLLFGKNPQAYFPWARIRFLKYEGIEEKTGTEINIIKDIMFEGAIISVLQKSLDFVQTQIKEYKYLHKDDIFHTTPEYPEFVWKEAIVNAVAHRDYHILDRDIQVKMFDDRFVVESPGTLPGLVLVDNMRTVYFSRNPVIARYLREYKFMRELGEGVDRMYQELFQAGLPAPEYKVKDFITVLTIRKVNRKSVVDITKSSHKDLKKGANKDLEGDLQKDLQIDLDKGLEKDLKKDLEKYNDLGLNNTQRKIVAEILENSKITQKQLAIVIGINERNIRNNIEILKNKGIILRVGSDKGGHWNIIK